MPAAEVTGLTPQEIGASAYRAYTRGLGLPEEWDGLALDSQAPWVRLAGRAGPLLERCEGEPYGLVARRLFTAFVGCEEGPGEHLWVKANTLAERLAWEGVARHLATLLDADEIPDLAALECSWADWVQKKLKGTE